MLFHEVRFPTDISFGSSGGPEYSTDIVINHAGYEHRNINWNQSRAKYNVVHGVRNQTQLNTLIAFFRARKGRAHGFRFKDWLDYEAKGQHIATCDGVTRIFQLSKRYDSGEIFEIRKITKPLEDSAKIYLDGVAQALGWSVNNSTGLVEFVQAPASNIEITVDFEFDVPVRFDTDALSASLDDYGQHSWRDISLIELRI